MNLILLTLDLYVAAHAVYWFLQETGRSSNHPLTPFLSRVCDPFCRLFQKVELRICGKDAAIAVPLLTLSIVRILLSVLI